MPCAQRAESGSFTGAACWQGAGSGLLDIEDGVDGVHGGLVLGGLTDQTLLLVEGDVRGGSEATLLVGNDLDIAALVDGNTRVGRACMGIVVSVLCARTLGAAAG